jgi:hypothetical protein
VTDAYTVAETAVRQWTTTTIATDRWRRADDRNASTWRLTRRSKTGRKKTVATFPFPVDLTNAADADQWARLARTTSLEFSARSWTGVFFVSVLASAALGALVGMLVTENDRLSGSLWQKSIALLILGAASAALCMVLVIALGGRDLREANILAPLWLERSADYARRAAVLRQTRGEEPAARRGRQRPRRPPTRARVKRAIRVAGRSSASAGVTTAQTVARGLQRRALAALADADHLDDLLDPAVRGKARR